MNELKTERLIIRPFTFDDAPFILRLLNEPSFIENIGDKGIYAREVLKAKRVVAIANEDNARPIKLLGKLGFERNGMIQIPDTNEDICLFESYMG